MSNMNSKKDPTDEPPSKEHNNVQQSSNEAELYNFNNHADELGVSQETTQQATTSSPVHSNNGSNGIKYGDTRNDAQIETECIISSTLDQLAICLTNLENLNSFITTSEAKKVPEMENCKYTTALSNNFQDMVELEYYISSAQARNQEYETLRLRKSTINGSKGKHNSTVVQQNTVDTCLAEPDNLNSTIAPNKMEQIQEMVETGSNDIPNENKDAMGSSSYDQFTNSKTNAKGTVKSDLLPGTHQISSNTPGNVSIVSKKISKNFESESPIKDNPSGQHIESGSFLRRQLLDKLLKELRTDDADQSCTKTHNSITDAANDELHQSNIIGPVEPTVSKLERDLLLRGVTSDNKKATILQLPPENMPSSPSCCEKEVVGDDVAKTTAHILCECEQPGVAGGAVPTVTSFTLTDDKDKFTPESKIPLPKRDFGTDNSPLKSRPSLIPKLSNSFRNEKLNSLNRIEKNNGPVSLSHQEIIEEAEISKNICFKTGSLQDRLKTSSTLVKEKVSDCIAKDNIGKKDVDENEKQCHFCFEDAKFVEQRRYKKLTNEFSKQVSRLAHETLKLSELENPDEQIIAVDNLYRQLLHLKKIGNELKTIQCKTGSETICSDQSQNIDECQANNELNNRSKSKDNNRIYIKFLPSKSAGKKRKNCNSDVQTDEVLTNVKASYLKSLPDKSLKEEICPKEIDSMDGMFIPSFDEPPKMEEDDDDDEDGLDITIRFPELQDTLNNQEDNSHLSVCFSNISAEALGRLKRCPKEFTLRMDFVQGKMFFQSARTPANNFAIGPDLKIAECVIDNKQSDIINIKPSTECLYTSQIIPVEGAIRKDSVKILKSTDSELFNVVSLPFVNRRNSVATKSCITFKNLRRVSSESLIPDRTYYQSMPQIPSLTNILEEPALETIASGIRAAMINNEKKPRYRSLQKKRTNASLENILHDAP